MKNEVWNLMYVLGNTGRSIGDSRNPQRRSSALEGAKHITDQNGWRVWVEHVHTKKRIFESPAEAAHANAQQAERIVRFAVDNVPGFSKR